MRRTLSLLAYYSLATFLPDQSFPGHGSFRRIREFLCRQFFATAGHDINVGSRVFVADGRDIHIGNGSGIGSGSRVYGAIIGDNVICGPNVLFLKDNHKYGDLARPIKDQGFTAISLPVVDDSAWIGERAIILPGRRIGKGAIVGAGAVVSHDVQPYEIVGGNPACVIGHRGDPRTAVELLNRPQQAMPGRARASKP